MNRERLYLYHSREVAIRRTIELFDKENSDWGLKETTQSERITEFEDNDIFPVANEEQHGCYHYKIKYVECSQPENNLETVGHQK